MYTKELLSKVPRYTLQLYNYFNSKSMSFITSQSPSENTQNSRICHGVKIFIVYSVIIQEAPRHKNFPCEMLHFRSSTKTPTRIQLNFPAYNILV